MGAREQANKQSSDNELSNGVDYWDYGQINHNGNGIEDRVSASSGIASANSSSMPWGLPELGSNLVTGQSFGPQVNSYHTQSTSPSGRQLPEGSLDCELKNLTIGNGSAFSATTTTCKSKDGVPQTSRNMPYHLSLAQPCELHGHSTTNHLISRPGRDPQSSTPSPHLNGLPQILRNDRISRAHQFSPHATNISQGSQSGYLTNGDTSQCSTIGSANTQQNSDTLLINSIANGRVNECLTETTDCASEISVLTATTNTTAGPLLSSRRESTRKSKKSTKSSSDKESVSTITKNDVFPYLYTNSSISTTNDHLSKNTKYFHQQGKNYYTW